MKRKDKYEERKENIPVRADRGLLCHNVNTNNYLKIYIYNLFKRRNYSMTRKTICIEKCDNKRIIYCDSPKIYRNYQNSVWRHV